MQDVQGCDQKRGGSRILRAGGSEGCECEAHCSGGERTRVPRRIETDAPRPQPENETDSPPALTDICGLCHSEF